MDSEAKVVVEVNVDPLVAQLQARLKESEKLRELAIADSCDDDTRIRELAKPFLSREQIEGDSYGVPGIIEVVESVVKRLKESEEVAQYHQRVVDFWEAHTAPGNPHHSIYEWLEWLWDEHNKVQACE